MALSKESRDALGRAVQRLRDLFEEEFSQQASGRFGLHTEPRLVEASQEGPTVSSKDAESQLARWIEPSPALSLTPSQAVQRMELVGAVEYLHREAMDGGQAVARVTREAAFTAVNRLLAVRVAEAVGVLPEALGRGRLSAGYRDAIRDLFPLLAQEDDGGLWTYLQVCGDELGATIPLLFDRRLPTSAFVPSRVCIDAALAIINDPGVAHVWSEPEALGWAYQFFNREDERQQMRAESPAPRDSRELAVRNQFFTPRYVVDWLVQNTLGRRLRQAGYEVDLPLLVGEAMEPVPLDLDDVRVLDPAVGSGHFLLGCYDLLEQAWQAVGISPQEAAPRILRSLYGIEIDPRASQVAQAVLVLRARRSAPDADLIPPAILTARPLPGARELRREVFDRLSENARELADELDDALRDAATVGSLLKVEERLVGAFERALRAPKLAAEVTPELLEQELLGALDEVAHRADASPAARMFAADAHDAIRFVELSRQRYDTVLMNPPFGSPVPNTHDYLRATYGSSAADMYAAFVHRALDLLDEHGYVGAITSRSGFFLTMFQDWRSEIVLPRMRALLDLGLGVMHDAMVEAAAYVLGAHPHHRDSTFQRLLEVRDKASAVYEGGGELFVRRPDDFAHIPGSPAAYWLPPELLEIFQDQPALEGSEHEVRVCLQTSDDFRFLRLWWEVPAEYVGRGRRWVPFSKGGDYSPYYSDLNLLVDWEDDGRRIRDFHTRVLGYTESRLIRSEYHYFRPGLTWTYRSQKGFSVRPVPSGSISGHKGPVTFARLDSRDALDRLMAYLNSALAAALLEGMVAFGSYEVGAIQRMPHLDPGDEAGKLAGELARGRISEAERVETDHHFVAPWRSAPHEDRDLLKLSRQIDETVAQVVGEAGKVIPQSATYPSRWFEEDYSPPGPASAQQEVSFLLGAALGRWDIRFANGGAEPPSFPDPYEPLPAASRGMLVEETGLPARRAPDGYPLAVPADRILHDEPGHPTDVVTAIEKAAEAVSSGPNPLNLAFRNEILDLRRYLRGPFFANHVKVYSASRRYAPIYWYLAVPSREWGLWVYAPALSRETLFAVAGATRDKLRRLREHAQRLQGRDEEGERTAIERRERVEALVEEVEKFAESTDRIAQSGWAPDLNDGLVLCAAPLEPLFADERWRHLVAGYRKDLEKGKYAWASVQRDFFGVRP
jgi:hypothetical protein